MDIGASHYKVNSTTYFLEKHLNWRGIAVDALDDYRSGYLKNRKNTRFFQFFVADKSDKNIDFYVIEKNKRLSTGYVDVATRHGAFKKAKVPTITLDDLLEIEGVTSIDFLSMDIERAEPAALAGFDISKYQPSFVCIEVHEEVLAQILEYFSRNNYQVIEKYVGMDPLNLYFESK